MSVRSIVVIAVLFLADRVLKKRFPRFYKGMELPLNIVLTLIVAAYCGRLAFAAYEVLTSGVSVGDKSFLVIFIGLVTAVYVALVAFTWIRWKKEKQ